MPVPTTQASPVKRTRPSNLPPPVDGEELVDMDLVIAVRDGSMPLEDEDALIGEIIKIYTAYIPWEEPVWWTPPIPEGEVPAAGDERLVGYDLKFNALTGMPVAFTLVASLDHKEPLYTKRIPRRPWPRAIYPCPLSKHGARTL